MHRRNLVMRLLIIMAGVLVICGATTTLGGAARQKVRFLQDWLLYGKHAVFLPAVELGYYEEVGLDVEIVAARGSGDVVKRIALGESEFGQADLGTLIRSRAKGMEVKAIGVWMHNTPECFYSHPDNPVRKPKDIEGMTIGAGGPGDTAYVLLPMFAEINNVDLSNVEVKFVDPGAKLSLFAAGEFPVIGRTWYMAEGESQKIGIDIQTLKYKDWGVNIYSNCFVVSDKLIAENPNLVQRFLDATYKGMKWAMQNPEKAVDMLIEFQPTLGRQKSLTEVKYVLEDMRTPELEKYGLSMAYLIPYRVKNTYEAMMNAYKDLPRIPVEEIYTNEFARNIDP
jgi:NitT/TauT family transport system substrate-binding protein